MKIELELDNQEAEAFLVARTKDVNVTKYSDEAKEQAVKNALYDVFFETLGTFEIQRAVELKKLQMQQWIQEKQKIYNGTKPQPEKEKAE
jgi:hypothetical protein